VSEEQMQPVTAAALRLRDLAKGLAVTYVEHTRPRAILLTGSAARGDSDAFSDLDLILYYEALPTEPQLSAARDAAGGRAHDLFAPPTETSYGELFHRDGVQCQLAHETIASWEAEIASVVTDLDVDTPLQKAIEGLFDGIPLHGAALIDEWRARARYSDALARAMVERHWRFFPLWHVQDRLATRDATLWRQQVLVESAYSLLGVMAGLNRLWFTPFQFKHMSAFVGRMRIAPNDLARRIESLFVLDARGAIAELEALVLETQVLVARELPEFDSTLKRPPGTRAEPWLVPP
jgi:hypothetical protein